MGTVILCLRKGIILRLECRCYDSVRVSHPVNTRDLKLAPVAGLVGEPHQLHLFSEEHSHVLELSHTALPVVNRAHVQVEATKLDGLSLRIDEEGLVYTFVILTHDQNSVVLWRRE